MTTPPVSHAASLAEVAMNTRHGNMLTISPHDHDVLCGRGGLTNHHKGNAWYRRLVSCNRPLYRSSPKHTKLLVSKAIVQAVHSQTPPGRFLERHKSTGLWHPVQYKRAVDKTSQALREKEREGEEKNGEEEENLSSITVTVRSGSNGIKSAEESSLHDLARAAVERAGGMANYYAAMKPSDAAVAVAAAHALPPVGARMAAAHSLPPVGARIAAAHSLPPVGANLAAAAALPPVGASVAAAAALPPVGSNVAAAAALPPVGANAVAAAALPTVVRRPSAQAPSEQVPPPPTLNDNIKSQMSTYAIQALQSAGGIPKNWGFPTPPPPQLLAAASMGSLGAFFPPLASQLPLPAVRSGSSQVLPPNMMNPNAAAAFAMAAAASQSGLFPPPNLAMAAAAGQSVGSVSSNLSMAPAAGQSEGSPNSALAKMAEAASQVSRANSSSQGVADKTGETSHSSSPNSGLAAMAAAASQRSPSQIRKRGRDVSGGRTKTTSSGAALRRNHRRLPTKKRRMSIQESEEGPTEADAAIPTEPLQNRASGMFRYFEENKIIPSRSAQPAPAATTTAQSTPSQATPPQIKSRASGGDASLTSKSSEEESPLTLLMNVATSELAHKERSRADDNRRANTNGSQSYAAVPGSDSDSIGTNTSNTTNSVAPPAPLRSVTSRIMSDWFKSSFLQQVQNPTSPLDSIQSPPALAATAAAPSPPSAVPPPLAPGVSATLLRLNPSRLLSGFSSLFERNPSISLSNAAATVTTRTSPEQTKPKNKTKGSLLDDYEESAMEAKLRKVPPRVVTNNGQHNFI